MVVLPVAGALLLGACGPFGPSPADHAAPLSAAPAGQAGGTTPTSAAPTTTTVPAPVTTTPTPPTPTTAPTTPTTVPAAQPVISGTKVGFSNPLWWESDAGVAADFDRIHATGATWVRFDFDWSAVQANGRNAWDWSSVDRGVDAAKARGLNVLAVADYTPTWARPAGTNDKTPPTNPADYATFVRAAAARYGPLGVRNWEIWNEPNNPQFWGPTPDVAAYTTLLRQSYAAIKAVDPGATVMTGGTSPAGGADAPLAWLQGIYANGGRSSFDAVAHHPYTGQPYGPSTIAPWNAFQQTLDLHNFMVSQGDANKRIWGTEAGAFTGTSTNSIDEATQAQFVTQYLQDWNAWSSFTGPLFYYSVRDLGTDPTNREDNFGLVHNDGTAKPGLAAVTNAIGR